MKENFEGLEVLVTGGAGYIGSHLCEKLISAGARVVSLDNYFTGSVSNHIQNVVYENGHTKNISEIFSDRNFDLIYHLGEYSRVEQSFDDVDVVFDFNRGGTTEVVKFATTINAKLVYAGSSTKFGDGGLGRDQSPYAWTKASNTELVINFGKWFGLRYAITYFYNAYGGREISEGKYSTVVAKFKTAYLNEEPITVVKPGTQLRNFTHINDIIDGLVLVGLEGYGDEFGIGADESISILELASMFGSEVCFLDPRPGNRTSADVLTHKTRELGWRQRYNIRAYVQAIKDEKVCS